MDTYTSASYLLSELLTKQYSTSFYLSSRLFPKESRKHIYAIYGLVRIADEIVDTYRKKDGLSKLNALENEVLETIKSQYSTNPIVHSFLVTAKEYAIGANLIAPFFESMRSDIDKVEFTEQEYKKYIFGSAEVVGLMCLCVFTDGDKQEYKQLEEGAAALGSAYQKVNFLRDLSSDYKDLGRMYFPGLNYQSFNTYDKQAIIEDIANDFSVAKSYINKLPKSSRSAVKASYYYYSALLAKLKRSDVNSIKTKRIRINNFYKLLLLVRARLGL